MSDTGRTGPRPAAKDTRSVRPPTPPPPKKTNPALLYGGIGGGALLLIILIAVMTSGNDPVPKAVSKPRKVEAPSAPSAPPRPVKPETGAIMFNCTNSSKHPDEEVLVTACPCGARKKFYADKQADGYRCLNCSKIYDNTQIKCPKCDRVASKTHLKPNFD